MEQDKERLRVIEAYTELEAEGKFDQDVEKDPEPKTILPGTVDYCQKKPLTRLKAEYAFHLARNYLNRLVKKGDFIIKDIKGIENLDMLDSGAVITCNHFSPMDSFVIQMVYEKTKWKKKRKFFRVIKEGNYTSYPGFYGTLMRNCNTLPLSSNLRTMVEFMKGVDHQLTQGNYVLVYAEQSMWWNYSKHKPLKPGAFTLAIKSSVPVVPVFICMEDTEKIMDDGFPLQAYTCFVGKPIFPDDKLTKQENVERMMSDNSRQWKEFYEDFYRIPLTYLCDRK